MVHLWHQAKKEITDNRITTILTVTCAGAFGQMVSGITQRGEEGVAT